MLRLLFDNTTRRSDEEIVWVTSVLIIVEISVQCASVNCQCKCCVIAREIESLYSKLLI